MTHTTSNRSYNTTMPWPWKQRQLLLVRANEITALKRQCIIQINVASVFSQVTKMAHTCITVKLWNNHVLFLVETLTVCSVVNDRSLSKKAVKSDCMMYAIIFFDHSLHLPQKADSHSQLKTGHRINYAMPLRGTCTKDTMLNWLCMQTNLKFACKIRFNFT